MHHSRPYNLPDLLEEANTLEMLQVQGELLHQCVPVSVVWMSTPREKAVRGEKGCEVGREWLWAVLPCRSSLTWRLNSVGVTWETMCFLSLTSTTAVLLNLWNFRMGKESLHDQVTTGRSIKKVYLSSHKSEVRTTLGVTVSFLTVIWPYTLISSQVFQFHFLKRARQYHSVPGRGFGELMQWA